MAIAAPARIPAWQAVCAARGTLARGWTPQAAFGQHLLLAVRGVASSTPARPPPDATPSLGADAAPTARAAGGAEDPEGPSPEEEEAAFVTKAGAASNVGLAGAKLAMGWASGSTALIADALHSAADLVGDALTLLTVRTSRKPPDEDHPYGAWWF